MHCPRCGQQQVSLETKFCSRCGFQMTLVSELLAHGGTLPQLAQLQKKKTFFNKKNGVLFGAMWFIFFTMFMASVWGILNIDEMAGISAVIGVFGSLCILIFSLAALPSSKLVKHIPIQEMPVPRPAPAFEAGEHPGSDFRKAEPRGEPASPG